MTNPMFDTVVLLTLNAALIEISVLIMVILYRNGGSSYYSNEQIQGEHRRLVRAVTQLCYGSKGEGTRYILVGGLCVDIAWEIYAVLVLLGINLVVCNAVSLILSIMAAFFLNKLFVFESTSLNFRRTRREASLFFIGRLFTASVNFFGFILLCDMGLDYTLLGIEGMPSKIVVSAIEITLNYFISKYLVFISRDIYTQHPIDKN